LDLWSAVAGHLAQCGKLWSNSGVSYPQPREEWIHVVVPALISTELFEAAAEQLRDNRQRYRAPVNTGPATHVDDGRVFVIGTAQQGLLPRRFVRFV
jgi:hypothetical protein